MTIMAKARTSDRTAYACELYERGFVRVPFPYEAKVTAVHRRFREFLEALQEPERPNWRIAVEDSQDPDDGLIYRDGMDGKDLKWYFHWKLRLQRELEQREVLLSYAQQEFLRACEIVYVLCQGIAWHMAEELDEMGMLGEGIPSAREALQICAMKPAAFSHSTLRLLYYPARGEGRRAAAHYDRSFLTVHIGDEGGSLYRAHENGSEPLECISPQKGEALVFFGKKAEVMAGGRVKALRHGSTAEEGEARRAAVFFAHTNVRMQHANP